MSKAVTFTQIEHSIEALSPSDQLKLLEKMVKHMKVLLLHNDSAVQEKAEVVDSSLKLRGALNRYANPALRNNEIEAFAQAMKAKHALH